MTETKVISKSILTQLPQSSNIEQNKIEYKIVLDVEELQNKMQELEQSLAILAGFEIKMLQAFNDEIALLEEASLLTQNDHQKQIFKGTSSSLSRIKQRWTEDASFSINKQKLRIEKS